jgi:hypothetical protein
MQPEPLPSRELRLSCILCTQVPRQTELTPIFTPITPQANSGSAARICRFTVRLTTGDKAGVSIVPAGE